MTYNFSGLENNTNILEFFTVVNTMTGDWLVLGLLLTIFVITFIGFKGYETLTALRTSAFITSIIGVLFYMLNFVSLQKVMYPLVFLGIIIVYTIMKKD